MAALKFSRNLRETMQFVDNTQGWAVPEEKICA
jgi:hypothetical protein